MTKAEEYVKSVKVSQDIWALMTPEERQDAAGGMKWLLWLNPGGPVPANHLSKSKRRGRPAGSSNKPKVNGQVEQVSEVC